MSGLYFVIQGCIILGDNTGDKEKGKNNFCE